MKHMTKWDAFVFGWAFGSMAMVLGLYLLDPELLNLVWLKIRILLM